tara:strand:- start:375 stop:524 length:150 start_codon:yes stop_codon:yes gene_type:complete
MCWQKPKVLKYAAGQYETQRDCVWLVAFGIKIAKGDESEGNSENFPIGR